MENENIISLTAIILWCWLLLKFVIFLDLCDLVPLAIFGYLLNALEHATQKKDATNAKPNDVMDNENAFTQRERNESGDEKTPETLDMKRDAATETAQKKFVESSSQTVDEESANLLGKENVFFETERKENVDKATPTLDTKSSDAAVPHEESFYARSPQKAEGEFDLRTQVQRRQFTSISSETEEKHHVMEVAVSECENVLDESKRQEFGDNEKVFTQRERSESGVLKTSKTVDMKAYATTETALKKFVESSSQTFEEESYADLLGKNNVFVETERKEIVDIPPETLDTMSDAAVKIEKKNFCAISPQTVEDEFDVLAQAKQRQFISKTTETEETHQAMETKKVDLPERENVFDETKREQYGGKANETLGMETDAAIQTEEKKFNERSTQTEEGDFDESTKVRLSQFVSKSTQTDEDMKNDKEVETLGRKEIQTSPPLISDDEQENEIEVRRLPSLDDLGVEDTNVEKSAVEQNCCKTTSSQIGDSWVDDLHFLDGAVSEGKKKGKKSSWFKKKFNNLKKFFRKK